MHVLPPELRMRLNCSGLPTRPQAMGGHTRSAQWQDLKLCHSFAFHSKKGILYFSTYWIKIPFSGTGSYSWGNNKLILHVQH